MRRDAATVKPSCVCAAQTASLLEHIYAPVVNELGRELERDREYELPPPVEPVFPDFPAPQCDLSCSGLRDLEEVEQTRVSNATTGTWRTLRSDSP